MRIRLLLAASAMLALASCGEQPTAPTQLTPTGALKDGLTCRSGYHIATREDGTEYCAPDEQQRSAP